MYFTATKGKDILGRWILGFTHPDIENVRSWIRICGKSIGYDKILRHNNDDTYEQVE